MNCRDYIEMNDEVLLGKPLIKGTRVSIEHIIKLLASGWSEKEVLDNYPRLTKSSLQAVFSYIQDIMEDGLIFETPQKTA